MAFDKADDVIIREQFQLCFNSAQIKRFLDDQFNKYYQSQLLKYKNSKDKHYCTLMIDGWKAISGQHIYAVLMKVYDEVYFVDLLESQNS